MPPRRQPQPLPPADAAAPRRTWLGWLRRWGISVFSLGLGLATLFVFRRGLPHVGWIVGYLLLLVLLVAAVTELRQPLERRGGRRWSRRRGLRRAVPLPRAPALRGPRRTGRARRSTRRTWSSSPRVVAGALVTAVDPWYDAVVRPRRWLNQALLAFSIFAALNVALPLVGIRPILALEGAAALTAVAMMPVFRERGAADLAAARTRCQPGSPLVAMTALWFGRDGRAARAALRGQRNGRAQRRPCSSPSSPIESPIPAADRCRLGRHRRLHGRVRAGGTSAARRARLVEGRPARRARAALAAARRAQGGLQDLLAEDRSQAALRRALPRGRDDAPRAS